MTTIKPTSSLPRKPGSKEIIEEFIDSDLHRCTVDIKGLDRKVNSVYVSLRSYLANHINLRISVSLQDGQIILTKE